jgi:diguanylate cyclase (GGDEF)-like protein
VRLITRNDTSLTVALIASTVILFRQPLRFVLDFVQGIEGRFHLDLLPALLLLVTSFTFHQYRKWSAVQADAVAAAADAAHARKQSQTLQLLMSFGNALANALDCAALQQVLWKHLPIFAHDRACWVLIRQGERWEIVVQDRLDRRSLDELERIAMQTLDGREGQEKQEGRDACFPMIAGGMAVGVLGVANTPMLTSELRDALGAAAAVIAIGVKNMQLFQEARELSLRDGLTGCFNRAYAMEALDGELRRARRTGSPLSILMFDVDHFKAINDTHGHLRGDEMLTAIGAQLGRTMRSTDIRCRVGGDEFLVILPETPSLGAQQIADILRHDLSNLRIGPEDAPMAATVSIGVAAANPGEMDFKVLIDRADSALYRAKAEGRNRLGVAVPPSLSESFIAQAM